MTQPYTQPVPQLDRLRLGPQVTRDGVYFAEPCLTSQCVTVVIEGVAGSQRVAPLQISPDRPVFTGEVPGMRHGDRYWISYHPDGLDRFPDPFSHFQPLGIPGPSQIIDPGAYRWITSNWTGLPAGRDAIVYELHIGTLSEVGTCRGALSRLPHIAACGANVLQVMPLHGVVGKFNWGYDNAALFGFPGAYGNPDDFRMLVDQAHQLGMAVIVDVVYNHFPHEWNLMWWPFGHDLKGTKTAWGDAPNFRHDMVREALLQNAEYWMRGFKLDGLRLDAVHHIIEADGGPEFLEQLTARVTRIRNNALIVAEHPDRLQVSPENPTLTRSWIRPEYNLTHQYADSVGCIFRVVLKDPPLGYLAHHAVATLDDLVQAINELTPDSLTPILLGNHDWLGNMPGQQHAHDRLGHDAVKAAALVLLLAHGSKLFFQGGEGGLPGKFCYFRQVEDLTSDFARQVSLGFLAEHAPFAAGWDDAAQGAPFMEPLDDQTFIASKVPWGMLQQEPYVSYYQYVQRLFRLHQNEPLLHAHNRRVHAEKIDDRTLAVTSRLAEGGERMAVIIHFGSDGRQIALPESCRGYTAAPLAASDERIQLTNQTVSFPDGAKAGAVLLQLSQP